MKNGASMFHASTHWNALHDPQIQSDAKMEVWRDVSWRTFFGIRIGDTQA
jgi:hypothetical protein